MRYLVILLMSMLIFQFANAEITKKDVQIYKQYNSGVKVLSRDLSKLRTMKDYRDNTKRASIEKQFAKLDAMVNSMSDQNDPGVKKLRKSFNKHYSSYSNNVKKAGLSKPTKNTTATSTKQIKKSNGAKTLQDIFKEFKTNLDTTKATIVSFKKWENYTDAKNMQKMKELFAKVELNLDEMKPFKSTNENSARNAYKKLKRTYDTNLLEAKKIVARNSAKSSIKSKDNKEKLTAADRKLLKKIRNIFIRNDYKFRGIDVISLQDPKNAQELKVIIDKLELMIEPVKDKTFDRGVRRTLEDFNTVKTAYNNALGMSDDLASKSGDVDAQLDIIQQLFNDEDFDPRIYTNDPAKIREWAKQMKSYNDAIPKTLEFFNHAKSTSIKARSNEFVSYEHWFTNSVQSRVDYAINDKKTTWNKNIETGLYPLTYKPNSLKSMLKDQSEVKDILSKLAIAKKSNRAKEIFEETYKQSVSQKTKDNKLSIAKLEEKTRSAQLAAIKNKKLPKPTSTDAQLLKLIKDNIHSVGRKLGNIEKIIITKTPENDSYIYWTGDYWNFVKWQWFEFILVEKEGDRYYIKECSLRKNLKGETHYPVKNNVWFLWHLSLEGDEILKNNI